MSEMTPQEKREYKKQEFKKKFSRFWLIYIALVGTGVLSAISGMLLPAAVQDGSFIFSGLTLLGGLFYAIGFLSNGEGAAYFWFDKLTDHDPDNTWQVVIASIMLGVSVLTIGITSVASAQFIAFAIGALSEFSAIDPRIQEWVVFSIPILWVLHFSAGTAFKALSDEADFERKAKSQIREITQSIEKNKNDARVDYWKANAPDLAKRLGELEAQEEIEKYNLKIKNKRPN